MLFDSFDSENGFCDSVLREVSMSSFVISAIVISLVLVVGLGVFGFLAFDSLRN